MHRSNMRPLFTCLADVLFLIFFCLAAFVQQNDPDPLFWEIIYLVPASLSMVGLCKPQLKDFPFWKRLLTVHQVFYSFLAVNLLWTLVTTYLTAAMDEKSNSSLENIFHIIELEEGRYQVRLFVPFYTEFLGVCFILAWLVQGKPSWDKRYKRKLIFFHTPLFIIIMPFVLWGCCYINPIHEGLSYCRHIAKTCTGDIGILQA